jgi:hypothetical protein
VWPRTQITPTAVIIFRLAKFWANFFYSLTLLTHVLKQLRLPVLTREQSSATTSLTLRHTTSPTLHGNTAVADDFASRRHLWPPCWSSSLRSIRGGCWNHLFPLLAKVVRIVNGRTRPKGVQRIQLQGVQNLITVLLQLYQALNVRVILSVGE